MMRAVVDQYIRDHREAARSESDFYAQQPTLTSAIHVAALSELHGKRHSHQRRIPKQALASAERLLQSAARKLQSSTDFNALHDVIERLIRPIKGIGELVIYDVSVRVGAFLGLSPTVVYLHAGAREGARALGFKGNRLDPRQLPPVFGKLSPAEIEDCLCIYKDRLRSGRSQAKSTCMIPIRSSTKLGCGAPRSPKCSNK